MKSLIRVGSGGQGIILYKIKTTVHKVEQQLTHSGVSVGRAPIYSLDLVLHLWWAQVSYPSLVVVFGWTLS